ncbi:hypothetical protein [Devosia sp. FJ2-5-3]|uniref:hypothetical protein n=1 Tax=Devosia sp. FJ2-5-3 TaxID=2976680 RepID=UPI0023D8BDC8|nr:hypothetical protein [Devosia sp. FJ2-5-3]WEJ56758.1 hypothetical protein N0P34_11035 [Devosia sp. FJ2-5-3]
MMEPLHHQLAAGEIKESTLDLMDAAHGLERDLGLDPGAVIRELTSMVQRRRQFEVLKRDHDVRHRGYSTW